MRDAESLFASVTFARDHDTPEDGFVTFYAPDRTYRGGELSPDCAFQLTMTEAEWMALGSPSSLDPVTFKAFPQTPPPHGAEPWEPTFREMGRFTPTSWAHSPWWKYRRAFLREQERYDILAGYVRDLEHHYPERHFYDLDVHRDGCLLCSALNDLGSPGYPEDGEYKPGSPPIRANAPIDPIQGENASSESDSASTHALGWHVVSGERLLDLLRRAAAGETPDLLYAEEWANADHEHVEGRCGICGGTDDVRHRGWTDDGSPMPTCESCGGPE